MSVITTAIAHDATCEKGDEWIFHNMAGLKETDDGKEEEVKPITEEEIEDAKTGCALFFIVLLIAIGVGIYYLVAH